MPGVLPLSITVQLDNIWQNQIKISYYLQLFHIQSFNILSI